jgi:two-component system OmpR family sensor kinase
MSQSLQFRLSVWLTAAIALAGLVAGAATFSWVFREANRLQDDVLRQTATLATEVGAPISWRPVHLPGFERDNDVLIFRLPSADAPESAIAPDGFPRSLATGFSTADWQGKNWRVFVAEPSTTDRIAVAQQTEVRDEFATHSGLLAVLPVMAMIPALILLVRFVILHALRPVSDLARRIDADPMANATGLPHAAVPAEVQPFVRSINRLLDSLNAALERQRRFVADAAHELRSPVAALRLQASNLHRIAMPTEAHERLVALEQGIVRTQSLLEQLLALARSQSGFHGETESLPVADVAKEVLADMMHAADAKSIDLGASRLDGEARVQASRFELGVVLRNAVDNALKYSPSGSAVTLEVRREGNEVSIRVEDQGPGVPAAELQRVFDPFYRVLGSGQIGSGLGLSIVAAIASRYGASVELREGSGGRGLLFVYKQAACA